MEDKEQVIDCFEEQLKNALNNTSDSCISINHHREIWELILKAIQDTKQALTTKSEKEQAFEIMVSKEVDIDTLIGCTEVRQYNLKSRSSYALTEKEFNFLKEIVFPTIVEVDIKEVLKNED